MLFLLSMLACLSEALFPIWFFQGVEKMKYITFINITTRVFATVFIFILIRESADYIRYPLIWGVGTFTGALAGMFIVFRKYRIPFRFQKLSTLVTYFRENTLYFFSNVSTQVYINANKIVVGIFLGMAEVAWYDIADKIVNIAKVPLSLLGQALFPKVARDRNIMYLKKIMLYTVLLTIGIVASIFIFSNQLIDFFSGTPSVSSIKVLRILSLSLIPISIGMFYGDLLLINFGLKTEYAKMRFLGFLAYLLFILTLLITKGQGIVQFALVTLLVETLMVLIAVITIKKYHIKNRHKNSLIYRISP